MSVNQMVPRLDKAFEMIDNVKILKLAEPFYSVVSNGNTYVVNVKEDICNCKDHFYRKTKCKHLLTVKIKIGMIKVYK